MTLLGIYLLTGFGLFLGLLWWAIVIDVLLSWMTLLGVQIIIGPLNSITRPLYDLARNIFPTKIGMIDIAPIIVIIILDLLRAGLVPVLLQFLHS